MLSVSDTKVKLQGNYSVIKMTNSFYSGKDLCKGNFNCCCTPHGLHCPQMAATKD